MKPAKATVTCCASTNIIRKPSALTRPARHAESKPLGCSDGAKAMYTRSLSIRGGDKWATTILPELRRITVSERLH
ncbi:MAG: hypothetical protein WBD69_00405 [Candidatus Cybelea sp.]